MPHIYAIGDVIDGSALSPPSSLTELTPVAIQVIITRGLPPDRLLLPAALLVELTPVAIQHLHPLPAFLCPSIPFHPGGPAPRGAALWRVRTADGLPEGAHDGVHTTRVRHGESSLSDPSPIPFLITSLITSLMTSSSTAWWASSPHAFLALPHYHRHADSFWFLPISFRFPSDSLPIAFRFLPILFPQVGLSEEAAIDEYGEEHIEVYHQYA